MLGSITTHRLCWGRPVRRFCCPTSSHSSKKWLFVKSVRVVSALIYMFLLHTYMYLLDPTFIFAWYMYFALLLLRQRSARLFIWHLILAWRWRKRGRRTWVWFCACVFFDQVLSPCQLNEDSHSTTISIDIFLFLFAATFARSAPTVSVPQHNRFDRIAERYRLQCLSCSSPTRYLR